ncbi:hypothetical protein [Nocardia sp. NPDC059691]|uniref:hypothetical protein n=1 Tax=Nocardia sp. NPDC059691 TaxID=3346908 RepID=UPI0036BA51BB
MEPGVLLRAAREAAGISLRGMSTMVETFAREARTARADAAALASEVTQYRGWLEHAVGADTAARRSLATAVGLAADSLDPDRLVHSPGFSGYVTWIATGDYGEVVALSTPHSACDVRIPCSSPTHRCGGPNYWPRGETRETQRAMADADAATETADGVEPPEAMYWWTPGFGAVRRGGVLALLGRHCEAAREATHAHLQSGFASMSPSAAGCSMR